MGYIFDALNRIAGKNQDGHHAEPGPTISSDQDTAPLPMQEPLNKQQNLNDEATSIASAGDAQKANEAGPFKIEENADYIDAKIAADDRMLAITEPSSVVSEEYRSIRTGILAKWQQKRNLVHTLTSATPQEGKTITTLNLGFSFAELRNRRTIVLEADLRLPQFDKMLALPDTPGLVGFLEGKASFSQVTHRLANDRLHVISAGRRIDNMRAVQLLSSPAMATLINNLRKSYDHVIIDTPPVIDLADAGVLGSLSDEVFLIARMNRTPRPLIEQAIRTLVNYNATVGGVIATDQLKQRKRFYYYKYGDQYGYPYSNYTSKKAA